MPPSPQKLRQQLKSLRISDSVRRERNRQIAAELLAQSPTIQRPNFTQLCNEDVAFLFDQYDDLYFDGQLSLSIADRPIEFRVSRRMTRAGGKTTSWSPRKGEPARRFEIAVSATLLFQTFQDQDCDREIQVTGLVCQHRLDAVQRVMEHELIHLAELLGWNTSSCSQDRFQTFAWQIFGHTEHRHALITPRQRASEQGIRGGSIVEFHHEGRTLRGLVNRVTKRATVLVPDPEGELFSDGGVYRRYYVPIAMLTVVDG